jgi:Aspartyl protease
MKRVMTLAAILIAGLAGAVAEAQTTIPLTLFMGKIPAFHARVNGHEGFFLFDTGGGTSVLSPEFAHYSGCTPWGRVTGFRMTGERIDLRRCDNAAFDVAGLHLKTPTAGVFDIMTLAPKTAPHLDGSLALDIFAGQVLTLCCTF